jgi:hypothetical protein
MKKIINIFLLGLIAIGFSSCLKDKSLTQPDADGAIPNIIEFQNIGPITSPTTSIYPVYVQSYDISPTGTLNVVVNYAGVNNAPNDITVTVAMDPTIIAKYNDKIIADARAAAIVLGQDPDEAEEDVAGDLFEVLDPSLYSLGNLNLVIPSGQRTATLAVSLKPDQFDFAKNTALAFKIVTVSGSSVPISGNFGNIVVKVGAKNRIDGVYNYKTTAATALRPNRNDNDVELATTGPNTVQGNLVNYYTNIVTYSVDPLTNKATVTNSGGIGTPITDPSSNYNPATKVLYVKWSAGTRSFEETYTYTGAR